MMPRIGWGVVIALVTHGSQPLQATAQSEDAFAGWAGLVTTPVGGLTPVAPGLPAAGWSVRGRWGHWQFDEDDDNTTNLGLGLGFPLGPARGTVEIGRTTEKDCDDCDGLLLGLEADIPLTGSPLGDGAVLGVALNPAAGYMTWTGDLDFSTLALALRVPVSLRLDAGESLRVVPFVSPGGGLGRISAGDESESGLRFLVGGGLGVEIADRLHATGSFNKIFIEEGATVFGIAVGLAF